MAVKRKNTKKKKSRAEPAKRSVWGIIDNEAAGVSLKALGYRPLSRDPTVLMCVDKIADLVSNMTLYLMENTDGGFDTRIRDGLSRKLDINPCRGMTRKNWIQVIVRTLLLEGDGNAIVMPIYRNGLLEDLLPLPPDDISFNVGASVEDYYSINYRGTEYEPDELLHFKLTPDPRYPWIGSGYRLALKDLVKTIESGENVTQEFLNGRYMPSVVITADADNDVLASSEGRESILRKYAGTKPGEPWIIPNGLLDVKTVAPLSLKDLAVNEAVELDKKAVAALLGVPSFLVGCGAFSSNEYNNFIQNKILSIAKVIEQTLTGLLTSPGRYFKFNIKSLYNYDIKTLCSVGRDMHSSGLMMGNEVRDWLNLEPLEGLNELEILENYIPRDMIGVQNKLKGAADDEVV